MYKKSAQTVILGIDPGYARLGYAISKKTNNNEQMLEYSCIETTLKDDHQKRILKITNKIEDLIQKYKPDVLAIEKVYFAKNQKTALRVSEIKGVILYLAAKNKMKIVEYTPLEIKVAVCGYGKATKEQVKKTLNLLIKIEKAPKHDDTLDAIAICLTCMARKDYI